MGFVVCLQDESFFRRVLEFGKSLCVKDCYYYEIIYVY